MLERLLYPLTPDAFKADYLEKQPLHLARPLPGWCEELPSIATLDAIIALSPAPMTVQNELRLVRTTAEGSEDLPVERASDGRPDMSALYRAYATGWTVVVNSLHLRHPAVSRLALGLSAELGHPIGVNLYFTPAGAQGFQAHVDGHDVFLLQLEGEKSWRVFPPDYALPLEDQRVPVKKDQPGAPLIEATTLPGHVLYIPRGFIHEGLAQAGASMHLTIGIHTVRWIELVEAGLRGLAEEDVRFRRTAPPLKPENASLVAEAGRELAGMLQSVDARAIVEKAMIRLLANQNRAARQSPDPQFEAIERARTLKPETEVIRRIGLRPRVVKDETRARIEFGTRSVSAPLSAAGALDFVATRERFRVEELPGDLSENSKIVLARRLIQEGLLTIPAPKSGRAPGD